MESGENMDIAYILGQNIKNPPSFSRKEEQHRLILDMYKKILSTE